MRIRRCLLYRHGSITLVEVRLLNKQHVDIASRYADRHVVLQSSTFGLADASRAIDGIVSLRQDYGRRQFSTFSQTLDTLDAFWAIELDRDYDIWRVELFYDPMLMDGFGNLCIALFSSERLELVWEVGPNNSRTLQATASSDCDTVPYCGSLVQIREATFVYAVVILVVFILVITAGMSWIYWYNAKKNDGVTAWSRMAQQDVKKRDPFVHNYPVK